MADEQLTPEREDTDKKTQIQASLGVAFVCLFLGLPLWWQTTSVYRTHLPFTRINQLRESSCHVSLSFLILSFTDDLPFSQTTLDENPLLSSYEFASVRFQGSVRQANSLELKAATNADSVAQLDNKLRQLDNDMNHRVILCALPSSALNGSLEKFYPLFIMGVYRRIYFTFNSRDNATVLISRIGSFLSDVFLKDSVLFHSFPSTDSSNEIRSSRKDLPRTKMNRFSRSLRPGYQLTFTLISPQPDIIDARWNVKQAINTYFEPLLKILREFAEFNVRSQYIHNSPDLSVVLPPVYNSRSHARHTLHLHQLPLVINPIESLLSSQISRFSDLNFVVYVPTRDQTPIKIENDSLEDQGELTAFLSPRWGGIYFYNVDSPPNNFTLPHRVMIDMRNVMQTFLTQFRLLIGIPPLKTTNTWVQAEEISLKIPEWQIDTLLFHGLLANIVSATRTLVSLADLLDRIQNIVIRDEIGVEVQRSLKAIERTNRIMSVIRTNEQNIKSESMINYFNETSLRHAFQASRTARDAAERAFFDMSLLELLYFPEDQKFAIYIPLFLPIGIPVLMSLKQVFIWWRKQEKKPLHHQKID